jgi:hypothetical protein
VAPSGGTRLLALSSDDGGEQWRYDPPHRPARLLAVVAGGLWWLDWQGGLNRVDVATGRNPERWTFPHLARPTGRVSAQGRLVMCEGSGLTVFDLTRGEQLVRRPFSGPPRPRRAHGQAAVLTKGGGILFVEPDGNLWAATYTDDAVARRVGKVETRPVDLTAAAGRLVLLLEGGAVIVLEPEMSG